MELSADNHLDDVEDEDEVAEETSPIKTPSQAIAADLVLDSDLDAEEKEMPDWRLTCGFQFVPLIDAETGGCFEVAQDAPDVELVDDEVLDWRLTSSFCFLPLVAPMELAPPFKIGESVLMPFLSSSASAPLFPSAARVPETKIEANCGPAEWIDNEDNIEVALDTSSICGVFGHADEDRFEELEHIEAPLSPVSPSLSEASDYTLVSDEHTLLKDFRAFEAYKSVSTLAAESSLGFDFRSVSDLTVDVPDVETIPVSRHTRPFHRGWQCLRKALKPQRSCIPPAPIACSVAEISCLLMKTPTARKSIFKRFVSILSSDL